MRWAFTRSSETVKQPVLFYALVWVSRARGPHTLTGRGKSPFHPLRSRCFVSAWVLDLRKNTGWFTVDKVPFPWPTIYPANFGIYIKKKIGHLELVPSGISPFLVLPSIRRYRTEYLALYAVLATKYLFHTHNCLSNGLPKWPKTLKTLFFFIFYHPSPRQPGGKVQSFGPGPRGLRVYVCVRSICGRVKQ